MWQPDSRRVTTVLVISLATILGWCYFGSADFFRQRLSALQFGGLALDTRACLYEIGMAFLLLACLPLALMKMVWRQPARNFGLGAGNSRRWILTFLATIPVFALIAWFGSASSELRQFYPRDPTAGASVQKFVMYAAARFFFYLAWEIHFRGFLQFALAPSVGKETSCLIQAAACSLAHLRGPVNEAIGAFVGGLWWGAHALGSRSIWGTTLQHWFLGITVDALICFYP
jgi:membrane protease YdiL (CAAX protease family)